MVMGPKHEHMLHVKALIEDLKRAAQQRLLLVLLQETQELVPGEKHNVFSQGLSGKPPTVVTFTRLRWKPMARAAKVKLRVFLLEKCQ